MKTNFTLSKYLPIFGLTLLIILSGCGGSSGNPNNGGNVTTEVNPITIDNAGVVPVIGDSSTSSIIYVHNNTKQTINGITYSSLLNTGHTTFINRDSAELCSSIEPGQSCPLAFTTPTLSKTRAQGSAMVTADYTTNNKAYSFSQTVNFIRINNNITQGVQFNSGVTLNGSGNDIAYGTIYIYGSGTNQTYTVDKLSSNKGGVTITQGNMTNQQIPSGYVTAIEVSSPTNFNISNASSISKTSNEGYQATLNMVSSLAGNIFNSTSIVGVIPVASGAILTSSQGAVVDSSVANPDGSIFIVNSGNTNATITSINYPSGVTESSGTTCSGTLNSGSGCVINFKTPQTSGSGNITINYTGGSSSSIAQTIVWYNGKDGVLLQMNANPNPVSFSATVGGVTIVTVTNIGGYNLSNLQASSTVINGSAVATVGNIESCYTAQGVLVESLLVGGYCTYLVSLNDIVTENGSINLSFSGDYTNALGSATYSRILALNYTSNQYRALLISNPNPLAIQVVGNNESISTQSMIISNNGEATATISANSLNGSAPAYLTESSYTCLGTLATTESCVVTMKLGPTTASTQESGSTSYDITYSGGQQAGTTLNGSIDYLVQANSQNILMANITAGGNIINPPDFEMEGGSGSSGYITLTYQNTGTNPIQITGITNTNSPLYWLIDSANSTCYNVGNLPSSVINSNGTCTIRFNSVLGQYANAIGSTLSSIFSVNITVPTLTFKDTVATNTQFMIQPLTPQDFNVSTIINVVSLQAIVTNSLTMLGSESCTSHGLGSPCVEITHNLARRFFYGDDIVVTTKMESYVVLPGVLNAGCTTSTDDITGIFTQQCTIASGSANYTSTSYYQIESRYLGENLHALFSINTNNQIIGFSPLSIQAEIETLVNKIIFRTNNRYTGDLKTAGSGGTGFEGANNLCNNDSQATTYGGAYKALLNGNNATTLGTIYYKTNRTTVIATATGGNLVGDSSLENSIFTGGYTWTGNNGSSCNNWTVENNSTAGGIGEANKIDYGWWDRSEADCDGIYYLYCAQQ